MCAFFEKHMTGSTVVERRSVTGELFLSYARPAADGWLTTYVGKPSATRSANLANSAFHPLEVDK